VHLQHKTAVYFAGFRKKTRCSQKGVSAK
jgi:hypothetical protein